MSYELVIDPARMRDLLAMLDRLPGVKIVGGMRHLIIQAPTKTIDTLTTKFGSTLNCRPMSVS